MQNLINRLETDGDLEAGRAAFAEARRTSDRGTVCLIACIVLEEVFAGVEGASELYEEIQAYRYEVRQCERRKGLWC